MSNMLPEGGRRVYQTSPGDFGKLAAGCWQQVYVIPNMRMHRSKAIQRCCAVLLVTGTFMGWVVGTGHAYAAAAVPWLYEVAVPVASQSPADRRAASGDALLVLLSRLTGLAYVPRTPQVRSALGASESFYNEFRFAKSAQADTLQLVVQFDSNAVLQLLKDAALPIWRSARPRVVAWLVVEQAGERQLLGATGAGPLVTGMLERARARGLPLTVPLLDLDDQLAVTPAAVWGRLSQVLEPASNRYGAEVLLIGRIRAQSSGEWASDWQFWLPDDIVAFDASGADIIAQAVAAVDALTDEIAGRSAVLGRAVQQLQVNVNGIRRPEDYGALLNYLGALEFIDTVGVRTVSGNLLTLSVQTRAEPDQLLSLFLADNRLFEDRLAVGSNADLSLVWRQQ